MNLDTIFTLSFILLPLCFAFICLYYAFYFLKVARQLEDTPTSKIRSAAQGFVELSGITKSAGNLQTLGQLSTDPVAWSRFQIDQLRRSQTANGTESYWTTIAEGASDAAFMIQDDTGKSLILPAKAEVIPAETIIWYGSSPIASKPPKTFWQWFFASSNGRFRYKEERIALDVTINARGMFSTLGQNPEIFKNYPSLNKNLSLLSGISLPIGYHYVISAMPTRRLSRNYKLKAFVFLIGFLIFSAIIVNSTFPVVKRMIQSDSTH
jgi:hypothetical protein